MYWNNCWLNNFNNKNYLNKTIFLENLFLFIFSEKLFNIFFKNKLKKKNYPLFKSTYTMSTRKKKISKNKNLRKLTKLNFKKKKNYTFTRVWFVKYNNVILISTFVFFYFKYKNFKKFLKTGLFVLPKAAFVFWKKKKPNNIKKKLFLKKNYLNF